MDVKINEMDIRRKEFILERLGCAHCASLIEEEIKNLSYVVDATLNFVFKTLSIDVDKSVDDREILRSILTIIHKHEPQIMVRAKNDNNTEQKTLLLQGLHCANCAGKIEKEIAQLPEVLKANLDFVTGKLSFTANRDDLSYVMSAIKTIINRIEHGVTISEISQANEGKSKKPEVDSVRFKFLSDVTAHLSLAKIITFFLGCASFALVLSLELTFVTEIALFLISYVLIGYEVIFKAIRNSVRGQLFDENFLMCTATVGAFAIREFPEAVAVMLFYQIGEFFQDMAVHRSRRSISELMNIRPDFANLKEGDLERRVSPQAIREGQTIIIKPGEKVPLDGTVIEGHSVLDTSALTGEFIPREVQAGSSVLAGFINKTGVIQIEVTKRYEESTVARILDMVENASSKKAPTENFISKFARYYTPGVVIGAALLALLPPLFLSDASFNEWLNRALVFLVVSCPCALVISIPLSFFGGIGGASRNGILIKGSNYLEALNQVKTIVFDKTGTLTEGVFEVVKITPHSDMTGERILEYAALVESYSNHPIATSILKSYGQAIDRTQVSQYQEISGRGVKAVIGNKRVIAGNAKMMQDEGVSYPRISETGTVVYLAIDGHLIGHILIADRVREDSRETINGLRHLGIKKIVMLTGDTKAVSEQLGSELGFDQVYAELLPDQKVEALEELEKQKESRHKIAFIGDGINDAPVLARADIGIAMGGLGSDAAIEAADIVLMTDEPSKVLSAVKIARQTRTIVWQNIAFALGVKAVVLFLGAIGIATMWEAVFADVGVAVIAILNAMRVLKAESVVKTNDTQ